MELWVLHNPLIMEAVLEGMCCSSGKDDKAAVDEHLTFGFCLSHSCETVVLPVSLNLAGASHSYFVLFLKECHLKSNFQ